MYANFGHCGELWKQCWKYAKIANLLWLILIFSVSSRGAFGATITAASPAATDVQAAINSASDGDAVIVPSGSATWSTTVSVTKGITLIGGYNTNGLTVITQGGVVNTIILFVNAPNKSVIVKNFTFVESYADSATSTFIEWQCNPNSFWRFCSNNITCVGGMTVYGSDIGTGLIDNNNFTFNQNDCVNIFGTGSGSNAWNYGTTYGTTNYLFFEHNSVNCTDTTVYMPDGVIDCYSGAKFVFRYNIITNADWGWHGCDSGSYRSTHSYEIYGNIVVFNGVNPPGWDDVFNSRGGTGLVFSNNIIGRTSGNLGFKMQYFRQSTSYVPWGQMTGSNSYDGNTSGGSPPGYPGLDQQGRTGPTVFYSDHSTQVLSPTYIWGNTGLTVGATDNTIQLNRDYYTNAPTFVYIPLAYPYPVDGGIQTPATNPPQITSQPVNTSVAVGQAVTFNVTASGSGTLAYQWYFNSLSIVGATNSSYNIVLVGTNNAGIYTAGVINNYGSVTSSAASLAVTIPTTTVNYYYVATTGSDSTGNGSIGSPWATLESATSKMKGGDVLYIRGGTYSEVFDLYGPNGTDPNYPTIIAAYPGETPIFNHNNTANNGNSLNGLNWYVISGLTIINYQCAMYIWAGCSNLVLTNMTIYNTGQEGLHVSQNSHDILLVNNLVHDTGLGGSYGEGFYIGSGDSPGFMDNTHNITLRGNTVYNTLGEGIEVKPGTYNVTVESNIVHTANKAQVPSGAGGGAIEVDEEGTYNYWPSNPNHIIRGNMVYDTPIGIRAGIGGWYYNNVIYNVTTYGLLVNNNDSDSYTRYVYNNTIDAPASIALVNSAASASILNNIGPTGAYNLASSSAYYINSSVHNYHLVAGSAPINAGTNLFVMLTTDFDGNARPSTGAFDIGAYQYASTNILTPPKNLHVLSQ